LNARKLLLSSIALLLLLQGAGRDVRANQLPGEVVTGVVTSVSNDSSISIDGKSYRIKSGSPAASAARTIATGQTVDAQLNGAANSAASEVVNLVTHTNR
jgi:predicted nucleic acid-binding Zn ribbon protein